MALIRTRTSVSVPRVFAFESDTNCSVKAPFMLTECLKGNAGMDLGMEIPPLHKAAFFKSMAEIQVALATIRLPKIGTIEAIEDDGTIRQGPIPGLGGPFNTAADCFEAWSASAQFGLSPAQMHAACGSMADQILPGIASFPSDLAKMASKLCVFDKGPFPLVHGDFGHNNIVVDDAYHVLGVIDWEMAYAAPVQVAASFPLSISSVPAPMDAPSNYDDDGEPKDAALRQKYADQDKYLACIVEAESARVSAMRRGYRKHSIGQRSVT